MGDELARPPRWLRGDEPRTGVRGVGPADSSPRPPCPGIGLPLLRPLTLSCRLREFHFRTGAFRAASLALGTNGGVDSSSTSSAFLSLSLSLSLSRDRDGGQGLANWYRSSPANFRQRESELGELERSDPYCRRITRVILSRRRGGEEKTEEPPHDDVQQDQQYVPYTYYSEPLDDLREHTIGKWLDRLTSCRTR